MKHSKKQILEAIRYWKNKLDALNESSEKSQTAIKEILKAAKDLGIAVPVKATTEAEELDESGAAKGFALGMLATILGICAMGKIANNIGGTF